jgi:hypothetical protein
MGALDELIKAAEEERRRSQLVELDSATEKNVQDRKNGDYSAARAIVGDLPVTNKKSALDALIADAQAQSDRPRGGVTPFASPVDPPVKPEPGFWQRALNAYDNLARANAPSEDEQVRRLADASATFRSAAEHPVAAFGAPIISDLAVAFGGAPTRTLLGTALNQGASALAQGTADSYARDPERGLSDALSEGGGLSWKAAALALGLGGAGKVATGTGDIANWIGDRARALAYGGAPEITPEVVRPAEGYAKKFGEARDVLGDELGAQTAQASAEGLDSQVSVEALREAIAAKAQQVASGAGAGVRAAASPYDEIIDQLTLKPPPNYLVGAQASRQVNPTTVPELHAVKTAYDKGAKYVGGEASEAARAQANKAAGDIARGQLYDIMDQSSVGPQFRQTMPDYGAAAAVAKSAEEAQPGLAAPSGSLWRWALRQLGRTVGPDAMASGARGAANVAGGLGRGLAASSEITGTATALADLARAAGKDPSEIDMDELRDFVRASQGQ